MQRYCGNNSLYRGLTGRQPTHVVGTNYECLKKGIGVGLNLPYDRNYSNNYIPIDDRKFYCGNQVRIPNRYFAVGSPSKCIGIGIGVGKSIANNDIDSDNNSDNNSDSDSDSDGFSFGEKSKTTNLSFLFLFFLLYISTFFLLYFIKPNFITEKDPDNIKSKIVDFKKLFVVTLVFTVIIGFFTSTIWVK
jgi:hypothetical protein